MAYNNYHDDDLYDEVYDYYPHYTLADYEPLDNRRWTARRITYTILIVLTLIIFLTFTLYISISNFSRARRFNQPRPTPTQPFNPRHTV